MKNIFHDLGDICERVSTRVHAAWDALTGKRLNKIERLQLMSIFSRLEALEASRTAADAVAADLTTRVVALETKPDVDAGAPALDALTARVTTLEGEVGTPATPPVA